MINTSATIRQIMTDKVFSVHPDSLMSEVSDIFESSNIHHLPVVENEKIVGILSKVDYYQLQHNLTHFKLSKIEKFNQDVMNSLLVSEVMTKQVATLHADDKITLAAGLFRENLFHAIPIVDDERRLVGIVTTYDLINYAFREPYLID